MAEEKSTRTRGISLPVLLGIIILVIMMAAGTSFLMVYLFGRATGEKPKVPVTNTKVEQKDEKPGITYQMEQPFIVNLYGSRHYLKVGVAFEVEKEDVISELTQRNAQLRDAINEIFRAQKQEDVADPELMHLKALIVVRINQILTKGKVKNVWFPEFQIQ